MIESLSTGDSRMAGAPEKLRSGLAAGEVHWWFAFPDAWPRNSLLPSAEILDRDECARLERFQTGEGRHLYLVAHVLLRLALSRCTSVHPNEWRFRRDRHGRPEIDDAHESRPLRFSLAHTQDLASCAIVLEDDVGVDVEAIRPDLVEETVALLTGPARESLAELSRDARCSRMLQCWTRYEAFSKAQGLPLQAPFDSFFVPASESSPGFYSESEDESAWSGFSFPPTPRHQASLAVHRPALSFGKVRCMRLDPDSTVHSIEPVPEPPLETRFLALY